MTTTAAVSHTVASAERTPTSCAARALEPFSAVEGPDRPALVGRGRLELRRRDRLKDANRAFAVEVDGQQRGQLRAGGLFAIDLSVGAHTVRVHVSGAGCDAREVVISGGCTARLQVDLAGSPWQVWREFTPHRYLKLDD